MKQGFNERNKTGKGGKATVNSNAGKAEKGGKRIGKSLPPKTTDAVKRVGKSAPSKVESFGKRKPVKAFDNEPGKRLVSSDRKKPFARTGAAPERGAEKGQRFNSAERKRPFSKPGASAVRNIPKKANASGEIRLNRFIANAGVCSRREADTFIAAGMVQINGKVVTELGTKVLPTDEVRFDGNRISAEKKVYLLLNKPKGFVTTTDDPENRKTVMDLVKAACKERIYPVGRLDRATTGVLLLTNDGDLASKLTHPKYEKRKIYQVWLDKPVAMEHMQTVADGIELEDGEIHADAISYVTEDDLSQVGIEIHSGKNRVVRRIFEKLGYRVIKLDRVYFAGLTKKNLSRGKWRYLSEKEVNMLRMGAFD